MCSTPSSNPVTSPTQFWLRRGVGDGLPRRIRVHQIRVPAFFQNKHAGEVSQGCGVGEFREAKGRGITEGLGLAASSAAGSTGLHSAPRTSTLHAHSTLWTVGLSVLTAVRGRAAGCGFKVVCCLAGCCNLVPSFSRLSLARPSPSCLATFVLWIIHGFCFHSPATTLPLGLGPGPRRQRARARENEPEPETTGPVSF